MPQEKQENDRGSEARDNLDIKDKLFFTMQRLQEKDYFKTSDIALCAALCCYGYQVEAVDKQNVSKAFFLICRDEQLDGLIQKYFIHQLKVEPLGFFNFLKEIKTRIYNI